MLFYKKTKKQKQIIHWSFIISAVILLALAFFSMSFDATKVVNPESVEFENLIQAKMILYKLKVAASLIAIGSVASYLLTLAFTNSPLGEAVVTWDTKDTGEVKASKTRNLGIVYGAFIVGIFFILSTVLGR